MRRSLLMGNLLAASVLAGSGCSDFRSLFSAHAGVAASAGGHELTVQELSGIMTAGRAPEPTRNSAEYLARVWVDHALFAQAAATGDLPVDSAGIAEIAWSEIAEVRGRRWHDTLAARRPGADPSAIDSLYHGDDVRVFQHILFRSMPTSAPAEREAARKKAESTLAQIRAGAEFGALAAKLSQDPGSAADSGYLPPSRRGQFVPAFDSAGWALAPGAASGIVETQFGYHLIKRPALDGARSRLAGNLDKMNSARLDSVYMDSLATANRIEVAANAPALIKGALEDPDAARRSSKVVTTFEGGELTVGGFVRWMQALPPHYMTQLKEVPDSTLRHFAKVLTQNVLLIRAADEAGIHLTADEWTGVAAKHRATIDTLQREMGLTGAELQDSTLRPNERKKIAMTKMEQYFDDLVAGRRRVRPIPPTLAAMLRDRGTYKIYASGVNRALAMAKSTRAEDSVANRAAAAPFRPAPGPAPVPGSHPADDSATHQQGAE